MGTQEEMHNLQCKINGSRHYKNDKESLSATEDQYQYDKIEVEIN